MNTHSRMARYLLRAIPERTPPTPRRVTAGGALTSLPRQPFPISCLALLILLGWLVKLTT